MKKIISVDHMDGSVLVVFSDATQATYSAAELLALRPERQPAEKRDGSPETDRQKLRHRLRD